MSLTALKRPGPARLFLAVLLLALPAGHLGATPGELCLQAAAVAAQRSGVPSTVMQAITLTETGRGEHGRLVPWPWSVNVGGESHWLASRDEAIDLVANVLAEGRSNVDVGCFQLNYRWHGAAFAALSDMFDPAQNADYAADFLKRLHAQTGDWTDAVGAYHSSTPENAERYLARYATVLATFDPSLPQMAIPSARANGFPLLMAGAMGLGASLVPRTAARHRLIGD